MVVLAASVVSKSGKPLVSRQYMEMSRVRIEGLLAAFPKLVGTGGKQHTYVETENVRYVYQPMEGLYLLLITNKQSNILEDLETLRLLSKIVPEYSVTLDEESVAAKAFELIFAFDEVIALGFKENVTIQQVKQNCEMESHEEKLHKMIIQSKINDTRDIMKKKAADIEKQKLEQKKVGGGLGAAMAGFGSSGKGAAAPLPEPDTSPSYRPEVVAAPAARPAAGPKGPSKGMKLGSSKKGADILESLVKEGEAVELDLPKANTAAAGPAAKAAAPSSEPVSLNIDEKLSVSLNKEGGLENLEVQGTMSLIVSNDDDAYIRIAVQSGANKGFQFKTHPNIDKNMYSASNVLGLKDPARPFPTGSELGILKWRFQSRDEALVPLTINCWPSVSAGQSYVNIEYESTSDLDLQNVQIAIPCSQAPSVNQCDGEWRFDQRAGALLWTIDLIDDTNRSGSMEFVVPATDPDRFYPVDVSFVSNRTFCDVAVASVEHTQRGGNVKYSSKPLLVTAEYQVA